MSGLIISSVPSEFLNLSSTLYDNSKLQLASISRSPKLWCKARALLLPPALVGKMSASMLIYYFSRKLAAVGLQASFPPYNTLLKAVNKKTDKSFRISDWH